MSIQQDIEQKLQQAFSPVKLMVENESHMHSVPPDSETHFKVTLVSAGLEGLGRVKRHQEIYRTLSEEMSAGVHALALHLFTPGEWASQGGDVPASPGCMGGSRHDSARDADEVKG